MQASIRYVFDSYALIGYLEDEPFSDRIEEILTRAKSGDCQLYLHALHLGEVYYITLREQGQALANSAYSKIKAFPVKLIEHIDERLLLTAAAIKAGYPISYSDSFAAALAKIHDCPVLTGDPEFKILEQQEVIAVNWLI